MWSTCSIETGHASTHAPQVTQSQIDSTGTPFPATGCRSPPSPSANTWSRSPMISSFGESSFPVAYAGQASWQRPHSVHVYASSSCFQVMSVTVAGAEAQSPRQARRSAAAPAGRAAACAPNQTLTAAVAMCRCFVRGR